MGNLISSISSKSTTPATTAATNAANKKPTETSATSTPNVNNTPNFKKYILDFLTNNYASYINIAATLVSLGLLIATMSLSDNQTLLVATLTVSTIVRLYQLVMLFGIFNRNIMNISLFEIVIMYFCFYLNHCIFFATMSYFVMSNADKSVKHYHRFAGGSTASLSDMFQYIVSTSVLFTTTDVVAVSETAKIIGYFNAADSFVILITFLIVLIINTNKSNN